MTRLWDKGTPLDRKVLEFTGRHEVLDFGHRQGDGRVRVDHSLVKLCALREPASVEAAVGEAVVDQVGDRFVSRKLHGQNRRGVEPEVVARSFVPVVTVGTVLVVVAVVVMIVVFAFMHNGRFQFLIANETK